MPKMDADVIIVGGGPSGLMLANELGRRNISVVLFNDREGTSPDPQANATQARTMEHFRRLGFANEVREQGLPADYPTDIAYFTRYTEYELARFSLPSSNEAKKIIRTLTGSWSAAELPHRVSQMLVERTLRKHAQALPSVELNFGTLVTEVEDHGSYVSATTTNNDSRKTVTAKYLVGCDGPKSLVRNYLGIEYAGKSGVIRDFMGGRMHAIYFRSPTLYDELSCEKAWMYWTFNRDRRSFMAAIDGKSEFVFHTQLKEQEEDTEINESTARSFVTETFGRQIDFEIISQKSWTAGFALVAERLVQGRMFIAGDAAHLFTPTGGLGYNTGIEDVVNLGWKLAAVLNGWGGQGLLRSYHVERYKSGIRNTSFAQEFADSIGNYSAAVELEDNSSEGQIARKKAGIYLEAHARSEFNIPGITFGLRYDGSPIICCESETLPTDIANDYTPTANPGGRAPHVWLGDSESIYDRFNFEFTLLCLKKGADIAAFENIAVGKNLPISTLSIFDKELRALYQADYVLIRPDQIVAWRGDNFDDIEDVLDQVTGNTSSRIRNIFWQTPYIDKVSRARLKNQKPLVIWFTGLPGSGKSTIANILDQRFYAVEKHTILLDGDNVRQGLNKDLGFSDEDRVENIRRISELSKLATDSGLIVIASFISPFKAERNLARSLVAEGEFIEVYIDASIQLCISRDPKGLYKKAINGEIKNFTGIDSTYEIPQNPEIIIDSANTTPEKAVDQILSYLEEFGYLSC